MAPERTCIGCGKRAPQSELVRVKAEGANVIVDANRTGGRGAWLHASRTCLDRAVARRAFARALRRPDVRCDGRSLEAGLTGNARKH